MSDSGVVMNVSVNDLIVRCGKALPSPTVKDLGAEQSKYDALYMAVDPTDIISDKHCHELEVMEAFAIPAWPRLLFSPVLCAGGGPGTGMRHLLELGFDAMSCDISQVAMQFYQRDLSRFSVCQLHRMPYQNKWFGMTICCDVMEHIPEAYIRPSLAEMVRVTRHALVLTISSEPSHHITDQHCTLWPQETWENVLSEYGLVRARSPAAGRCHFMVELLEGK